MSNTAEIKKRVNGAIERHPVLFAALAITTQGVVMGVFVGLAWVLAWGLHFLIRG
jgi:hypothetical protein